MTDLAKSKMDDKTKALVNTLRQEFSTLYHEAASVIEAQAARIAELETALKRTFEEAATVADNWSERNGRPDGVWAIAAGIRALSAKVK